MLPGVYIPSENLAPSRSHPRPSDITSRENSPEDRSDLSPFLYLIALILHDAYGSEKQEKYYHTPGALMDTSFTGQRPIIGEGHHFTVFSSPFEDWDNASAHVKRYNPEAYCIKFPNPGHRNDDGFFKEVNETALREIKVLCQPNLESHANIIGFLGLDFHEDYDDHNLGWPCPLMEVAEFGTLDSFQYDQGQLNEPVTTNLLLDISCGLDALHKCNIIHGDVKSENVLICKHIHRKYVAKISDFGLSIINPDREGLHKLIGGTWLWEAPEFGNRMSVQGLKQTDLFSLGLLIWRVLTNTPMPYETLGRDIIDRYRAPEQKGFIIAVKQDAEFCGIVLHSLRYANIPEWAKSLGIDILPHSLGHDPTSRNLQRIMVEIQKSRSNFPQRLASGS
jgi:serine/threonine protein kinase